MLRGQRLEVSLADSSIGGYQGLSDGGNAVRQLDVLRVSKDRPSRVGNALRTLGPVDGTAWWYLGALRGSRAHADAGRAGVETSIRADESHALSPAKAMVIMSSVTLTGGTVVA